MSLIRFDEVTLEIGELKLLTGVSFSMEPDERVCLIGRNGAGKSTLLKLITGEIEPDGGEIVRKSDLRVSQLRQDLAEASEVNVRDFVRQGMAHHEILIHQYQDLSDQPQDKHTLRQLEALQRGIEAGPGWNIDQAVDTIISQLDLPASLSMAQLSGGWRRRASLGQALVSQPDLLLLDEPTNHLDISTIEWLEQEIRNYPGAVLFISHDRAFVSRLSSRIAELDRGVMNNWPGNYREFLAARHKSWQDEDKHNAEFDKKLAQEETWIRQGIKARRTRNEGRVRALESMREERAGRIRRLGQAKVHISEAEVSGRKVITAKSVNFQYGNLHLVKDFSLKMQRGDRVGLIGNNGVGKSTLLKLMLGELAPQSGTVKLGTNLKPAYFDQHRSKLDPEKTVAETVGAGQEYIKLNGKERHVVGYMVDFLFSAKRAMTPVKVLSGGERNRVLLAQIFTQSANLLVLDEPTNDLDVEMLDALEGRLRAFDGTLIVVSHDREFLDNVVDRVLVFEADGMIREYVGGYTDWLRHRRLLAESDTPEGLDFSDDNNPLGVAPSVRNAPQRKKLSYRLQRELDALPDQIETLETQLSTLQKQAAEPAFYQLDQDAQAAGWEQIKALEVELAHQMGRWTELEAMLDASGSV